MNTNSSGSNLIFLDRHLSASNASSVRRSTLREACQEPSEVLEVSLRVLLVLSMLAALLIGGWHASVGPNTDLRPAPTALAVQGFSVSGQHTF